MQTHEIEHYLAELGAALQSQGVINAPRIVPTESSAVAYDDSCAASTTVCPAFVASCVTAVGTYADPAHKPAIDASM